MKRVKFLSTAILLLAAAFMFVTGICLMGASAEAAETTAMHAGEFSIIHENDRDGMQWTVTLDETEYAKIATKEIEETGILVIPTDMLEDNELTIETAKVGRNKTTARWADENGTKTAHAYLYDIPSAYYNRLMSWRGYIVRSGGAVEYTETVSKSAAQVAVEVKKGDTYATLDTDTQEAVDKFCTATVIVDMGYRGTDGENVKETVTVNFADQEDPTLAKVNITFPERTDYEGTFDYDPETTRLEGDATIKNVSWKYVGEGYRIDSLEGLNNAEDFSIVTVDGSNKLIASDKDEYIAMFNREDLSSQGNGGQAAVLSFDFNGLLFESDKYSLVIRATLTVGAMNLLINCDNYYDSTARNNAYVYYYSVESGVHTTTVSLGVSQKYAVENGGMFQLNEVAFQGMHNLPYTIYIHYIAIVKTERENAHEVSITSYKGAAQTLNEQFGENLGGAKITDVQVKQPLTLDYLLTVKENKVHFESPTIYYGYDGNKNQFFTIKFEGLNLGAGQKLQIVLSQKPGINWDGNPFDVVAVPELSVNGGWNSYSAPDENGTVTLKTNATGQIDYVSLTASYNNNSAANMTFNFDIESISIVNA